jgi:Sulfotransferase family
MLTLGAYMGDELNVSLDNLWFALLFRRPDWYRAKPAQVPIALRVFGKAMRGRPSFDRVEIAILRDALLGQGPEAFRLARSMRMSSGPPPPAAAWGWKNPVTHIYLEQLAAAFPRMRYVHVIRNGLDLAHKAKTARQVHSWGHVFGIDRPSITSVTPPDSLHYWACANRRALKLGSDLLGDRFLLLRYESICSDPRGAVKEVGEFLGVRPRSSVASELSSFIAVPPNDRDPSSDADRFDAGDLAEVEAFGYACPVDESR